MSFKQFSLLISFFLFAFSLQAQISYVDQDATGSDDGSSWVNAYEDLQDALMNAVSGDTIWVAEGVYKPTMGTSRGISFVIPDSVKVFGGFSGTETPSFDLNLRNFETNETLLSGDIGDANDTTDNSFHVVRTNYVSPFTEVNGFTIAYGNADDGNVTIPDVLGGGFFNNAEGAGNSSNPTVKNCIFRDNYAISGGGFYNFGKFGVAKSTIINCKFISNSSRSGGGILNNGQSGGEATATVINSVFYDNTAEWDGGGVMNFSSASSSNNSKYINCTFYNNKANLDGDHVYIQETIGGNTDIQIANSIFYRTTGITPIEWEGSVALDISYSLVNGPSCTSLGLGTFDCEFSDGMVFDNDFDFVDKENGDLRTSYTSSARNAGLGSLNTTAQDILGRSRVLNDTIDIGAYEGINEAFVNLNSTLTQNGTTWQNGIKDLQAALIEAKKVWVAKGTYYPAQDNDRFARFELKEGMELYGGFVGTENVATYDLSQRNLTLNETILSANIGSPTDSTDNSYRILNMISSASEEAKVDGFTFTGAQADRSPYNLTGVGGGIRATGTSHILNCKFSKNYAFLQGGAILTGPGNGLNNPIIENCTFFNNSSSSGTAIYCEQFTSPKIKNCSFIANLGANVVSVGTIYIDATNTIGTEIDQCNFEMNTVRNGAAICIYSSGGSSDPSISNSIFKQNTAARDGGALYLASSSGGNLNVTIVNSVFDRNTALFGGAIHSWASGGCTMNMTIDNSLFVSNVANSNGGALLNLESVTGQLTGEISNTIFWDNKAHGVLNSWSNINNPELTLAYSLVQEASCTSLPNTTCTGTNIFNTNPEFVDFANNDYRLSSSSPAINAGVNDSVSVTSDLLGRLRIKGGTVDMGPYETVGLIFVNQASTAGAMNGSTWNDAFIDLQDALQLAVPSDTIWVAQGTYKPTSFLDPNISYKIPDSVKVFGGFNGTEHVGYNLNQRNFTNNETILSGNIGTSDNDNSHHVISMKNVSSQTFINGFTITKASNTALVNDGSGGGSSSPLIENCIFEFNIGEIGGAILNNGAAGMAQPKIRNCIFNQNESDFNGGAIYNDNSSNGISCPSITGCTFYKNTSYISPRSIFILASSTLQPTMVIKNCIFWNSMAIPLAGQGDYYVDNSVVDGNSCNDIHSGSGTITCGSAMVYNQDPLFANVLLGNFKLQAGSPAIDIGTREIDFIYDRLGLRHVNKPDAGAHEYPCSQIQDISFVPLITDELNSQNALQTLQANNTINPTSNVYYQAGESVLLSPGFEVKSGNVFEAVIDNGCLD